MSKSPSGVSRLMISKKLVSLLGISFLVILLFYASSNRPKTKVNYFRNNCYLPSVETKSSELEDFLRSKVKPTPGRSIFFHETSCHPPETNYFLKLTARQACSIESAALRNPNYCVFFLIASYTRIPDDNPLLKAILSYKNVYLRQLNIWDYVKDTPIEKWFDKGELFRSR